jgi:hypothetical protein
MSARVAESVERRFGSTSDEQVTLLVGVSDSDDERVRSELTTVGATIEETLPLDYLAVSVPESKLEALCRLDGITSVEFEGSGTVLDEGNP